MKLLIVIGLTLISFCKPSDKELEKENYANVNSSEIAYDSNEILFVNAKGGLRLRSEPSTKSNVVNLIPRK